MSRQSLIGVSLIYVVCNKRWQPHDTKTIIAKTAHCPWMILRLRRRREAIALTGRPEPREQGCMSQTPHRPTSPSERLALAGIAALTLVTVLIGALAPGGHGPAPRTVADDPTCLEWSDGCQVCKRWPDSVACSLPGIACEPGAQRCLIRNDG